MSNAQRKTKQALVWIVWNSNTEAKTGSDSTINVLARHGGLRVYEKDRYDSRAGENLPYFRTLGELGAFFVANPGKPAQIDTRTGLYDGDE